MAVYYAASSLDGFIADDADSVDWLDALPQPSTDTYTPFIADIGALAMGRASYEFVARHVEGGGDWPYSLPCWVFTNHELPEIRGADVRFVSGPVEDHMEEMQRHGKVWVVGGGDLAGQFLDAGHLDELIITVGSQTLGSGKPLLPRTAAWELQSATPLGKGFVELRYRLADPGAKAEAD